MASPQGLQAISSYARGIGPHKDLILPRGTRDALTAPSELIRDAHNAGLVVHPWTLRAENAFLPADFRSGADSRRVGDMLREALLLLDLDPRMDGGSSLGCTLGAVTWTTGWRWATIVVHLDQGSAARRTLVTAALLKAARYGRI